MTPAVIVAICAALIAAGSLIISRLDRWKDRKGLIGVTTDQVKLIPGEGDSWKQVGVTYNRDDVAGAENSIRAVQAACSYSWRIPPRRSCRRNPPRI
jgi:hypothetical protein